MELIIILYWRHFSGVSSKKKKKKINSKPFVIYDSSADCTSLLQAERYRPLRVMLTKRSYLYNHPKQILRLQHSSSQILIR